MPRSWTCETSKGRYAEPFIDAQINLKTFASLKTPYSCDCMPIELQIVGLEETVSED
jgi:hypothetical protein